jgi:hypothetical protein
VAVTIGLMVLALAFAASARAETDLLTAVAGEGTGEGASPAQSAPSPAPTEQAEPSEPVESEEAPAPEEARPLVPTVTDEPSGNRVTQAVETIHEDAASVTAPLQHSTETATRSLDRTVSAARDRIDTLAHDSLRAASDALRNVTGPPPAEEKLHGLPSPEEPPETGAGSLPPSAALRLPVDPLQATDSPRRASAPGGLFPQQPGNAGDFELLHAEASRSATGSDVSAPTRRPVDAVLGSTPTTGRTAENLAPPGGDDPLLPPDSPLAAVAGSGGSSFVPIVGLLALLALVAPTILRRLREVPELSAPALFVCALERPG